MRTKLRDREIASTDEETFEDPEHVRSTDGLWCRRLTKEYPGAQGIRAVDDLDLTITPGEFVTLLGPSGSGKTTTLRMLSGLERPTSGEVGMGSRILSSSTQHAWVSADKRDFGMVFQSYAVWPHMTVGENIAFPLKARRKSRATIREAVERSLRLVDMTGYRDRNVTTLSGGQQQRVAVARAVAYECSVLLLDEPLSNLDVWLRGQMREELKQLQRQLGITTVYVTHDQSDAYALSDRVALMHESRLEQIGSPQQLFDQPQTAFVASFVGSSNVLPVTQLKGELMVQTSKGPQTIKVSRKANSGETMVAIKPDHVRVEYPADYSENSLPGVIVGLTYLGERWEVRCTVGEHFVRARQERIGAMHEGEEVSLVLPPEQVVPVRPHR